jgi:hypothetical protein
MTDANFPFPVKIFVGGKERPGRAKGNEWLVPLRRSETFEIDVENRSGQPVCLRLLVDGLNTLPDLPMTKGVATLIWGQHVSLETARHWVLDPAKRQGPKKNWRIRGFVTETGPNGRLRQFVIGSSDQSLAAKRKFTDEIGLITAAFYDPKPPKARSRGNAVIAGQEVPELLPENVELVPDKLRAVVNIRYVDPDEPASSESLDTPPAPQPGPVGH